MNKIRIEILLRLPLPADSVSFHWQGELDSLQVPLPFDFDVLSECLLWSEWDIKFTDWERTVSMGNRYHYRHLERMVWEHRCAFPDEKKPWPLLNMVRKKDEVVVLANNEPVLSFRRAPHGTLLVLDVSSVSVQGQQLSLL